MAKSATHRARRMAAVDSTKLDESQGAAGMTGCIAPATDLLPN